MDDSQMNPTFFKVYLPKLTSTRLRVPIPFFKHIKHETSRTFSLIGPSGKVWNVNLIENDEGYFFEEGWPVFVRDHFMKFGDFLLFIYDGNSHFTVQIFDKSGCEKESAFDAICSQDTSPIRGKLKNMKRNKAVKDKIKVEQTFFENSHCFSNRNMEDSQKHHRSTADKYSHDEVNTSGESNSVKHHHGNCSTTKNSFKQVNIRSGDLISERRNVTEEEKKRAYEAAKAFNSKNPFITIVMRCSHVYHAHCLPIPTSFKNSHLPKSDQEMILWDPIRRSWPVTYIMSNLLQRRGSLSAGWGAFVHGNNIEEDDVCIFELIRTNEMKVHIFRVVQRSHH